MLPVVEDNPQPDTQGSLRSWSSMVAFRLCPNQGRVPHACIPCARLGPEVFATKAHKAELELMKIFQGNTGKRQ